MFTCYERTGNKIFRLQNSFSFVQPSVRWCGDTTTTRHKILVTFLALCFSVVANSMQTNWEKYNYRNSKKLSLVVCCTCGWTVILILFARYCCEYSKSERAKQTLGHSKIVSFSSLQMLIDDFDDVSNALPPNLLVSFAWFPKRIHENNDHLHKVKIKSGIITHFCVVSWSTYNNAITSWMTSSNESFINWPENYKPNSLPAQYVAPMYLNNVPFRMCASRSIRKERKNKSQNVWIAFFRFIFSALSDPLSLVVFGYHSCCIRTPDPSKKNSIIHDRRREPTNKNGNKSVLNSIVSLAVFVLFVSSVCVNDAAADNEKRD